MEGLMASFTNAGVMNMCVNLAQPGPAHGPSSKTANVEAHRSAWI